MKQHSQQEWDSVIDHLAPGIHPVDRDATRIWFAFWPLKLARGLRETEDLEALIREWRLEGNYRLEQQLPESLAFLWGCHYWPEIAEAVLAADSDSGDLKQLIRDTAEKAAEATGVEPPLLLGAAAAALMALQQIGVEDFTRQARRPFDRPKRPPDPEKVIQRRIQPSKRGWFSFLKTVDRDFRVVFDERSPRQSSFQALHGQDVSMASANDQRDYTERDYRRLEGPVPFECRSGSCGFCWIGVLGGRERLEEITDYEVKRLKYFGYRSEEAPAESHPVIRLACQSQVYGDLTIAIPPWNGTLDGRE